MQRNVLVFVANVDPLTTWAESRSHDESVRTLTIFPVGSFCIEFGG